MTEKQHSENFEEYSREADYHFKVTNGRNRSDFIKAVQDEAREMGFSLIGTIVGSTTNYVVFEGVGNGKKLVKEAIKRVVFHNEKYLRTDDFENNGYKTEK